MHEGQSALAQHEPRITFLPRPVDKYEKIRQNLHAALPSQHAINILIGTGKGSIYLHVLCNPYHEVFDENARLPANLSLLPNVSSHPALLARKLLQLAVCMQQLDPSFDDSILQLSEPLEVVMSKYVDLATALVTTNEKLIDSLEGMECLILEGVFLINSGNLRRAWLCFRRAMSLAQFMGFHRGTPLSLKVLDSETQASCSVIWFRIAYAERYLSLLMGVPSGLSDNSFASEENMAAASSCDRLDRVHAVICGLILQRNESESYDEFATTQKIDFDLQRAAKTVPPKWWLSPNMHPAMGMSEMISDLIRAQTQIIHHNLLTLLHLPFMLRNASERRYDYSKTTCIYASREVLTRWISFRTVFRVVYCCRWVDFCAYTASMTLLLAHIDSHRNNCGDNLIHQRLCDRNLVEMAMDTMDELNRVNGDILTKQTAEVTRKLLTIESNACNGLGTYSAKDSKDVEKDDEDEKTLRLKIPYFGTVSIAHEWPFQPQQPHSLTGTSSFSDSPNTHSAFTPSSSLPSSMLGQTTAQLWQQPTGHEHTQDTSQPLVTFQADFASQNLEMTDFVAESDEWALQGVDTTFFDAVMKGNVPNQGIWDESWSNWDTMQ